MSPRTAGSSSTTMTAMAPFAVSGAGGVGAWKYQAGGAPSFTGPLAGQYTLSVVPWPTQPR